MTVKNLISILLVNSASLQQRESWIQLSDTLSISPAAPTLGENARIFVKKGGKDLSIYFDSHNRLGFMPQPYWEAYLGEEEETYRFLEPRELATEISVGFERLTPLLKLVTDTPIQNLTALLWGTWIHGTKT